VELSWTTFILEAINFLVLVWLLKRLFYVPVKRAIAERRAAVQKTLQDAEKARREAEDLKSKYEGRLQEWEREKERQREEFRTELNDEKTRQLKLIENSLKMEREKAEAREQKQAAERRANEEKQAIKQALEFTSRLLGDLASQELEGKIVDLTVEHIASGADRLPTTFGPQSGDSHSVTVRSAYPLTESRQNALAATLKQRLGDNLPITFNVDQRLLAGLEIAIGSYVLRANLRDELEYFSSEKNHE
jgi:F-type H+-transporting ATPase subunit b